jgi:hypothetical protein
VTGFVQFEHRVAKVFAFLRVHLIGVLQELPQLSHGQRRTLIARSKLGVLAFVVGIR